MIKELKYNGYTANTSDYESEDGDLDVSLGMICEEGRLKPVSSPTVIMQLNQGEKIAFIHKTASYKHYIILNENGDMSWKDDSEMQAISMRNFNNVSQIVAIGNTLIVLSDDGMHYFLWKGQNEGYTYLGTRMPECSLSFGLLGEMVKTDSFEITFDNLEPSDAFSEEMPEKQRKQITEQVLAKVNKFIAEESTNKGRFLYPFLLRYAYRLYDGTLTMHSAPILMIASSDVVPQVFCSKLEGEGTASFFNKATLEIAGALHTIDYAVENQAQINALQNWKDIINSIDIFVSQPIYTYDQSGEFVKFIEVDDKDAYCVCKHTNQAADVNVFPLRYQRNEMHKLYSFTFDPVNFQYPRWRLMLPHKSEEEVKSNIRDCAHFYFLHSIKVEELTSERTKITVDEEYLQSLVTREVMTDDYDSHDTIIPKYAFEYNSRLNVANISKNLFNGYAAQSLFNFSDGYINKYTDETPTFGDGKESVYVYVYIKQDGKDIIVQSNTGIFGKKAPLLFFYYPNINAYKAVITKVDYTPTFYEIKLEKHNFLNGAFYFGGWEDLSQIIFDEPEVSEDKNISLPNKIYTSEVNNPFFFPLLGINTVGTGDIYGIRSAAKALSEGQFGQFPLYAFTSEGVWALEVSDTGSYSARQPVTRDVCINPESITQIDSAVLFATNRGIMIISGSQTTCITDTINSPALFSIEDLPKKDELLKIYNDKQDSPITTDEIKYIPFLEFLSSCKMIYDYTHQRIIVYNSHVSYAYIFSLKSKMWGMMLSDITDNVNSYPEALAMAMKAEGSSKIPVLVNCSDESGEDVTTFIVTRPFKLDDPNILKTISTIIQRGFFKSENINQVLYGSNDLYNWNVVWSSKDKYLRGFRGTPFKAFRLAWVATLNKSESILGCTVQFNHRMTNKPR